MEHGTWNKKIPKVLHALILKKFIPLWKRGLRGI